jgi:hypothetical protein
LDRGGRDGDCSSPPRADPDGPNSGIRFLPRVFDGKTHMWPGMKVVRLREPVVGQSRHPFPREPVFLATPPVHAVPEPDHVAAESADTRAVRGNRVIGKVAPDDLRQPPSLLGYRLMHALAQLLLDLLEFHLHAITPALSMYKELAPTRLAAYEGKTQELEGFRFAKPCTGAPVRRMAAKLDQAGLFRMQRERKLL